MKILRRTVSGLGAFRVPGNLQEIDIEADSMCRQERRRPINSADTSFIASSVYFSELLGNAERGKLQLPALQREWVWDEERIRELIASISRGFPVGAVMTLRTGGCVTFKPRPVDGAPASAAEVPPDSLLLDGQQRLASLFQTLKQPNLVAAVTTRGETSQQVVLPGHGEVPG